MLFWNWDFILIQSPPNLCSSPKCWRRNMSSPMEAHGGHIVWTSYGSSPWLVGICIDCNQDYPLSLFCSSCLTEDSKVSREGDHEQRTSQTASQPQGCDASLAEGSPFLSCPCEKNFFKIASWLQHLSRKWYLIFFIFIFLSVWRIFKCVMNTSGFFFFFFSESCLQAQWSIKISLVLKSTVSLQDGTHWHHNLHL